jgi:hypothetical protein
MKFYFSNYAYKNWTTSKRINMNFKIFLDEILGFLIIFDIFFFYIEKK